MNDQRSKSDQVIQFLLMGMLAFWAFQYFNGAKSSNSIPPRPARTVLAAFAGLDPSKGPVLTKAQANAQITSLNALVAVNPDDGLANWANLRVGLIQQYVLGDLTSGTAHSGFLSLGALVKYYEPYNTIIASKASDDVLNDDVVAQAIYQEGDLLWRESTQHGAQASPAASTVLDSLIHRGRGYSKYIASTILVPVIKDPAKVPLTGFPPGGFVPVVVGDLHGTLASPDPQGIVDRLNAYYQNDPFYKAFDFAVVHLGNNPAYSYGLAVLIFSIVTRTVMLPLTKKQYESMRGMALIGPEMKKIQDRYKGNTDQAAQMAMIKEIQNLQKRHGVNPYLGCGLSLLQMPIFFLFVYPLIQHYQPKMELAGASFLWIGNLAQRDIPLLVLYGISMFFSFRLSSTPPADETQRNQQVIMSFVMPLLFPFFISTYPAAFTMYWMTFNVMSTIFQWQMIKKADPKKNVVRSLMGTDLVVADSGKESSSKTVPPRPTNVKALPARPNGKPGNSDNGLNGSAKNGSAKTGTPAETSASQNGSSKGKPGDSNNGTNGSAKSGSPGNVNGLPSNSQNGTSKSGKNKKKG